MGFLDRERERKRERERDRVRKREREREIEWVQWGKKVIDFDNLRWW